MNNEEYIRHKLRILIREGIADFIMKRVLKDKEMKLMMSATLYGAPYSTKPYVLKKYTEKKEEEFTIDLKHIFNDNVIVNHDKKAREVITYTKDNKQLFTIKLSSDRLRPSYIRFDFLKPKEKIKIPVTISKEEVEKLILDKKQTMIDSGFEDIFK